MPYWRLYYHVVWSTQRRTPWLDAEGKAIVEAAIRSRARDSTIGAIIHGVAVMPDHVHVAVTFPPTTDMPRAIGQFKGVSSHLVRERQPAMAECGFSWQGEYGLFSLSERGLPQLLDYLANQETHHRAGTIIRGLEYDGVALAPDRDGLIASAISS